MDRNPIKSRPLYNRNTIFFPHQSPYLNPDQPPKHYIKKPAGVFVLVSFLHLLKPKSKPGHTGLGVYANRIIVEGPYFLGFFFCSFCDGKRHL